MKRLGSSDSLGALMSICPTTEEHSPGTIHNHNHVYGRDFQSMLLDGLDEEGCVEDQSGGHVSEKKRRLSVDQVKALEKNFEMENKLEPDRKVKLAQELGLQPRQVAVWFQNRRARWKTKQLERDYGVLKSNYESLKLNYDSLRQDNETLLKEIRELKSKLYGEKEEKNIVFVKEETMPKSPINSAAKSDEEDAEEEDDEKELHFDKTTINGGGSEEHDEMVGPILFYPDLKDGSSDSDSSAILNDENLSNSPNQSSHHQKQQFMPPATAAMGLNTFGFSASGSGDVGGDGKPAAAAYQPQFVKIEEHNFFSGDEPCNFFSDEQAPTLHWYCQETVELIRS